jgi:hypothetical protein
MAVGYRAFLLGPDGHVVFRVDIHCDTEEEAKQPAQLLVDGHDVELWKEARKIATFPAKH